MKHPTTLRLPCRTPMPRTTLAAFTCLFGLAAVIVMGADWSLNAAQWPKYLCCVIITVLSTAWFAFVPDHGCYLVIAMSVGDFLVGGTAFAPVLLLALLAMGSIGYANLIEGVLAGIALLAAALFSPYAVAFPTIDNNLLSFPCLIALTLCISMLIRRNGERQRQLQREQALLANAGIAQRLHDYTTNDLGDIVMMADHQLATCDDGQREVWTNVRKLALDALAHTRKAILTLESNRPAAGQNDGTNQDDHEWRTLQQQANDMSTESSGLSELDELITVCRGNLAANGCAGEVLRLGVEPTSIDGKTAPLIIGLVRELFGNIAKHADVSGGYTMLISWTDAAFVIELSDVPKPSADAGLRSGLERYHRTIESMQGQWNVKSADDHWSIHAEVPYRRTIC